MRAQFYIKAKEVQDILTDELIQMKYLTRRMRQVYIKETGLKNNYLITGNFLGLNKTMDVCVDKYIEITKDSLNKIDMNACLINRYRKLRSLKNKDVVQVVESCTTAR